jgi:hypothetical protein
MLSFGYWVDFLDRRFQIENSIDTKPEYYLIGTPISSIIQFEFLTGNKLEDKFPEFCELLDILAQYGCFY